MNEKVTTVDNNGDDLLLATPSRSPTCLETTAKYDNSNIATNLNIMEKETDQQLPASSLTISMNETDVSPTGGTCSGGVGNDGNNNSDNDDDNDNHFITTKEDPKQTENMEEQHEEEQSSDTHHDDQHQLPPTVTISSNTNPTINQSNIINHIKKVPEQTKSWHLEILFGFFINCDDNEMNDIARKSKLKYSPTILQSISSPTTKEAVQQEQPPPPQQKQQQQEEEEDDQMNAKNKQNRKRKRSTLTQVDDNQIESNVFPIFTEVLQRFKFNYIINNNQQQQKSSTNKCITNNQYTKDNENNVQHRRSSYASRTIQQIEHVVMETFKTRFSISSSSTTSKSDFHSGIVKKKDHNDVVMMKDENNNYHSENEQFLSKEGTFVPISLMYNECSMKAISDWAKPSNSRLNTFVKLASSTLSKSTPSTYPINDNLHNNPNNSIIINGASSKKRKRCKMNHKIKRNMNLKRVNYVPVSSTTFRKCTICNKFGHYEVECEALSHKQLLLPQSQCAALSKWLYKEVKIQNVLRDFASPFTATDDRSSDNSSDDSDDEAIHCLDVKQDMDLLRKKKKDMISYGFDCVGTSNNYGTENKKITKTDFLTSPMKSNNKSTSNSSKCEVPNESISPEIKEDHIQKGPAYEVCEVCRSKYLADELLVCDGCDRLYHKQCLDPPLEHLPEGYWFCSHCYAYDSDVSSVIEIEAIDDFVIEQRKLTKEEKANSKHNGYYHEVKNDPWNTHVMVIPHESSLNTHFDELPIPSEAESKDRLMGDQHANNHEDDIELAVGELCFAKRSAPTASLKAVFSRDMFWPAMVLKIQNSNIGFDGSIQTKYIVKFFALAGSGRVRASHVLPFFPNYEKLAQNKLKYTHEEWYSNFRRGLIEALGALGISSLAQGLSHAREIISNEKPKPKPKPKHNGKPLKNHGKEIPEDGDLTYIDDFAIVSLPEDIDPSQTTFTDIQEKDEEDEKERIYNTEELIGGVVSFAEENKNGLNFGVLSGVDTVRRKVLVHLISDLSRVIKSSHKEPSRNEFRNSRKENLGDVYTCKVGASLWIPIESIIHFSTGSRFQESQYCSYIINETLSGIQKEIKARTELEQRINEDRMMKMDSIAHLGFENALDKFGGQSSYSESRLKSASIMSTSIDDIDSSSYVSIQSEDIVQSIPKNNCVESKTAPKFDKVSTIKNPKELDDSKDSDQTMYSSPSRNQAQSNSPDIHQDESVGSEVVVSPSKCPNGKTIFIVDKILDDRINKQGFKEYLIKWKGFDDEENSWEIERNIFDTNVLRKYLAQKLLNKLRATDEARIQGSDTCRAIEVMKNGIHLLNTMLTIAAARPRKKKCPFCLHDFNIGGIAPHIKSHSGKPNFDLIKQVCNIADIDWYKG